MNQENKSQPNTQGKSSDKFSLISERIKNLSPDKFMEKWKEEQTRFAQLQKLAEEKRKEKIKKEKAQKRTQRGQRLILMGLALSAYLGNPEKTEESKKAMMNKLILAHEKQQKIGTPDPTESQAQKNARDIEILKSALEMVISGDLSDWKDAAPKDTTRKPKQENQEPKNNQELKPEQPEPKPKKTIEINADEIMQETQQQEQSRRINAMSFED